MVVVLGAAVSLLAAKGARADNSCSVQCDDSCQTCCAHWEIHASCGSDTRTDGDFGTYLDALDAAAHANANAAQCTGGDASCAHAKLACVSAANGIAPWSASCRGAALKPEAAMATRKEYDDGRANISAARDRLTTASGSLVAFTQAHVLTKIGETTVATTAELLRAAAKRLDAIANEGDILQGRGEGPGAALTTWKTHVDEGTTQSKEASAAVDALMQNPAAVNAAADEKNRLAREALAARKAKLADLQKNAETMKQQIVTSRQDLATFLATPSRAPAQQKRAATLGGDLDREDGAWTKLGDQERTASEAEAVSADRVSSLEVQDKTLSKQTLATASQVKALDGSPSAAPAVPDAKPTTLPKPAAVIPVGVAPSIPTCSITVVPAAGSSKLTVTIDDGKPLTLPADVKLAGGRHTVVAKSGTVTKKSSELVICNRTKTLSVEGPR
jgi:hypothetical protein